MHADPEKTFLVLEQVDVMIARSHGAELVARHGFQAFDARRSPRRVSLEQRVLDLLGVGPAQPEADVARNILGDRADAILDLGLAHVEARGEVAAADVEAYAGDRDVVLVGDHAADRVRVAEMGVGAQHSGGHAADLHAAIHLRERALVMPTEDAGLRHGRSVPMLFPKVAAARTNRPARASSTKRIH